MTARNAATAIYDLGCKQVWDALVRDGTHVRTHVCAQCICTFPQHTSADHEWLVQVQSSKLSQPHMNSRARKVSGVRAHVCKRACADTDASVRTYAHMHVRTYVCTFFAHLTAKVGESTQPSGRFRVAGEMDTHGS